MVLQLARACQADESARRRSMHAIAWSNVLHVGDEHSQHACVHVHPHGQSNETLGRTTYAARFSVVARASNISLASELRWTPRCRGRPGDKCAACTCTSFFCATSFFEHAQCSGSTVSLRWQRVRATWQPQRPLKTATSAAGSLVVGISPRII